MQHLLTYYQRLIRISTILRCLLLSIYKFVTSNINNIWCEWKWASSIILLESPEKKFSIRIIYCWYRVETFSTWNMVWNAGGITVSHNPVFQNKLLWIKSGSMLHWMCDPLYIRTFSIIKFKIKVTEHKWTF